MEAECNALLSHYNFQFKIKDKQLQVISSVLKQQDTFAVLPTGYGNSICYVLPPLILDKVKINVYGPVPNRLPVISMSTHFHAKTVETADNPVYNVLFFFVFFFLFCKRVFRMFSREFQHNR